MEHSLQRSSGLTALFLFVMVVCLGSPARAALGAKEDLSSSLAFAAATGTPEEVKAVTDKGIHPDKAVSASGAPALSVAAMRRDEDMEAVIDILLKAGANINIEDRKGETPLFYAARVGNVPAVRVLLARGADFYHADREQNVARTLAFREGRHDVVKAMDDYMNEQSLAVRQQYERRSKEIEERNKEIGERDQALLKRHEEAEGRDREMHRLQEEMQQKLKESEKAAKEAEQAAKEAAKPKAADPHVIAPLVRDLSFHSCAAAYFDYVRELKLDNENSRADLKILVQAHDTLADEAARVLVETYGANDAYVRKIVRPSEGQIIDQLSAPPTNLHRISKGMGTKKDMEERCADIADEWELIDRRRYAR